MKNIDDKHFLRLFKRWIPRGIPWEILIALGVNIIVAGLFFVLKPNPPQAVNPPVEISVDISDFTPPKPQEMVIPPATDTENSSAVSAIETLNAAKSPEAIAQSAMQDFAPSANISSGVQEKSSFERKTELERIEQGIRAFAGINQVRAGLPEGTLPAGHRVGSSFQGRGDAKNRAKLLKRHGGGEKTESAVEKVLAYLTSVQNSNGSWGSPQSFKTGDAAALSSLALLAFFSHGENFQSPKYGEPIRKGCDFLIELANTPNIEYAGDGFGHAILTYALAEGFALTGSMSLRNALEQRLKFILSRQNKFGSFALNYDNSPQAPPTPEQLEDPLYKEIVVGESSCDLSLLGWHIQALTAARNAGAETDGLDKALALATEALIKIHQADKGGFSQGINMKRFHANDNMNPVGLLGLHFLNAARSAPARRAEKMLEKVSPPKWRRSGKFPLYRWYYQTQAVFLAEKGRGKRWDDWNENLKTELIKAQKSDGSWPMPGGDNSFKVKNKTDLTIYSSSLCALMLQVYYRYLPSYSIAESSDFSSRADDFDLGSTGLISRLPGGADPMASVILGIGVDDMEPIRFGTFNGVPAHSESPHATEEFPKYVSMRSTIAVRKVEDWPQTLQPNQRIALFFDDLLPKNFKGNMRLRLGIVGDKRSPLDYRMSFEAILNGKRLYNAIILREKQLIEIVIPSDVMQPFGNIMQIRNNGKATLAFDATELSALNKVGKPLYLYADDKKQVPADLSDIFSAELPKDEIICKLSALAENRQLLLEIEAYDPEKLYIGEYPASGTEYMGNAFQLHYLRQTGREIIDWISGGGSGVKITDILSGGKFYDTIFSVEYPAVSALRQVAKLFEGNPHQLATQIYPKYGDKPALFCSSAASYNAPGIVTVIVAKRFPIPDESELVAIIPWNGETEMTIERGFLPEKTPFAGFAPKIEQEKKTISIVDNTFRYSGVFPELTVIRLARKGTQELPKKNPFYRPEHRPEPKFDFNNVKQILPANHGLKKHQMRNAKGYATAFGQNGSFSIIPATVIKDSDQYIPVEKESLCITFRTNVTNPKRFDSVYLPLGNTAGTPHYLSFYVFARASGLKEFERMNWATLRFALCGKLFSTTVSVERWQRVVLPINDMNVAWNNLRILEPTGFFSKNLQTVSFEINDISIWKK